MNRLLHLLLACALVPLVSGCALLRSGNPDSLRNVERDTASHHIALAQTELAGGKETLAIERLARVRVLNGLTPEQRARTESLLRRAVQDVLARFESGADDAPDSGELDDLFDLELPPDLRARAGILAARALFQEDHPVLAYRQIRDVDRKLPGHAARNLAADVLAELGLAMARNESNYYWLFSYRKRGVTALEYLVLQYPLSPACPEAYTELGLYYEDTDDLDYAIERLEDLIVYHPTSAFSTAAEARLPYLRMRRLTRDDYDRSELVVAADEIRRWLARHPGHELESWVSELQRECDTRLARSDVYLARYYDKIDSPFGARLYAERALAEALSSGAETVAAEARTILSGLPDRIPGVNEIGPVVPDRPIELEPDEEVR